MPTKAGNWVFPQNNWRKAARRKPLNWVFLESNSVQPMLRRRLKQA
jgi:hypothetical protein